MNLERERKFLVHRHLIPAEALIKPWSLETGYFTEGDVAIRVSLCTDAKTKICFKGPGGEERMEFEYEIPRADAEALIKLSPTYLTKRRFLYGGWEIDCIDLSAKEELWMAEWEEHEGKEPIPSPLPDWISSEVTGSPIFTNQNIAWKHGKRA